MSEHVQPPDNSGQLVNLPTIVKSTLVNQETHPDLEQVKSVILKDGPKVQKVARFNVVRSRHTGSFHHNALVLETNKKVGGILVPDDKHTISLSSEVEDEIQKLIEFLLAVTSGAIPNTSSKYLVFATPTHKGDPTALQSFLRDASTAGKIDAIAQILQGAGTDPDVFRALLERAAKDPKMFSEAAAALNLASYQKAVDRLEAMVAADPALPESDFQHVLTEHPWMFGSEYSELLDRRTWTRDEKNDFVVRRTTDGYIELIEIKTTLGGAALFNHDKSHESYYAGAELSKVLGQVEKYLETLDSDRDRIFAHDKEDANKIRAKIVVGRDGDDAQKKALRRFNGHLHRIEILTFDHLVRIARNVLKYLEHAASPSK